MAVTRDIRDLIDSQKLGSLQVATVGLCMCIGVLDGFDLQAIGFLAPPMADSLHLDIRAFGPVFAASLFGLMLGTLVMGPVGDRWGRKRSLVAAIVLFSLLALATPLATSLTELEILRFVTGIGLGACAPNVFALAAETVPRRMRRTATCLVSAALPAGVVVAAGVAAWMMPRWGWPSVFYLGGALPLALAAIIAVVMPDSLLFSGTNGASQPQLHALARRLWPALRLDSAIQLFATRETVAQGSVLELFRDGRAFVTLMLWLTFAMNLLIIYFIVSWMPTILRATGLPPSAGLVAVTAFGIAGIVGSIVQGPLITRYPAHWVMLVQFALYIVIAVLFPALADSMAMVALFAFAIGCTVQSIQAGLNAFASGFYPTAIRSTGVGWGQGIGRLGSVVGPLLGGVAIAAGWTPAQIFIAGVVPAVVAGLAVLAIAWRQAGEARAGVAMGSTGG